MPSTDPIAPKPSRFAMYLRWIGAVAVVVVAYSLLTAFRYAREDARCSQCKANLKQIGLALLNYRDAYRCFPPAYTVNAEGRPIHSWRVLILPFLGASDVYDDYHFDEPWDGPNNRELASRLAARDFFIYHCDSDRPEWGNQDLLMTSYVAVLGDGTAWRGDHCLNPTEITDRPENTLLVVEVADSGVKWMEPRDLQVEKMAHKVDRAPGQGISSRHRGEAHAVTADDRIRTLPDNLSATTIRALLTIRGGEQISNPDF